MSNHTGFHPLGKTLANERALERVADIDPRLSRTHYFDGRLLTAEDLIRDQIYLDQRLREVGQALGSGVMRGLEIELTNTGQLQVQPGSAVTPAGRVLQLTRTLTVDLGDRALIASLNKGRNRRFDRGLYAVTLQYAEVSTDIAEVFPRDLAARAEPQPNLISEGAQLGLVPLPQPLPQQSPYAIRAALIREYVDGRAAGIVPEDAVALGVLAVANDRPEWLDAELLRQPLRPPLTPGALQADLSRHYETLFRDLLASRRAGGLSDDFPAAQHFKLLPPVGSLPKAAVDPAAGRQSYFPESFQVWVAPMRLSDLTLVREESMRLSPIDLARDQAVDIIVLAPLANEDYGRLAGGLERSPSGSARLAYTDPLRLRLYPLQPVHQVDTDENTWRAIWDQVDENQLLYIRRPLRAAETAISGIVLAQGIEPPPAPVSVPSPSDGDILLQDEDALLLDRINFELLASLRPPQGNDATAAQTQLAQDHGDDAVVVQAVMSILLRVERRYDGAVWQTLRQLADNDRLLEFRDRLPDAQAEADDSAAAIELLAGDFGFDAALVDAWAQA